MKLFIIFSIILSIFIAGCGGGMTRAQERAKGLNVPTQTQTSPQESNAIEIENREAEERKQEHEKINQQVERETHEAEVRRQHLLEKVGIPTH